MYSFKQFSKQLFFAIIYWVLAFSIFILIRFVAHGEEQGVSFVNPKNVIPITEWIHFGVILGVLVGCLYAIIEFAFEKFITNNIYLGLSIILKTGIYILVLIFSLTFIIALIEVDMDIDLQNEPGWWKESALFWLATSYFFLASFIFLFLKLAFEKFGKGVLFNMLMGKYRNPTEEERIFMFIDLKSSTTIAEEIGHTKYSKFLQDCFFDLGKIVSRYDGEIYQYVGDEAVITWKLKKGIKNNNCIELYFAFAKQLKRRSKYYLKKYNIEPFFKAGVHGGELIITQVGTVKKELAFHGDVINTTARIQDECNTHDESLLISEVLLRTMDLKLKYSVKNLGEILLKGKSDTLKIIAIHQN
ncbi:adenylate/guanylate cyclase domain-containing protein [Psychroserpens damuponensis]|uniref:adenylate/guanylate cyclase domain-containing protein n=1 Tax=Psychroserpens damuponensis TaxID=943936 RepID=UPI00058C3AF6|nr:adenylate/guanylate cyclase domain-containing protein [Psychroserpens damuponensis]